MAKFQLAAMTNRDIPEVKKIEKGSGLSNWSVEDYRNELERDDSVCRVVRSITEGKDEVIGFLLARTVLQNSTPNELGSASGVPDREYNNFAEINNIAIKPDFRRLGIGSRLIDDLIALLIPGDVAEIWLEVRESNSAAIAFYDRIGFTSLQIRKNYYQNPPENAVLMRRKIPE